MRASSERDASPSSSYRDIALRCPVDDVPLTQEDRGNDMAVARCDQHDYPIVGGIPILLATPAALEALHCVRVGDSRGALAALLTPTASAMAETIAKGLDRLLKLEDRLSHRLRQSRVASFRRRVIDSFPQPTFRQALEALCLSPPAPDPIRYNFFYHRPADPTYVLAEAIAATVPAGRVLDLCCGAGHLTAVLARQEGSEVVAVDENYFGLYLGRNYLAPRATFVGARADRALPFPDGSFDTVVCNDAIHDIDDPSTTCREMFRVLAPDGVGIFIHCHNAAHEQQYPGKIPLLPQGYASLLAKRDPRLFDERTLLARWLEAGSVDLSHSSTVEQLRGAPSLTIVVGSRRLDRLHGPSKRQAVSFGVNPLYQIKRVAGGVELNRHWPSEFYRREYPEIDQYLAERHVISDEVLARLRDGQDDASTQQLVANHVLVELPAKYGTPRPWLEKERS